MPKVVTELDELLQSKENARTLASIARLFDRIDDPFKMPDAMIEWLKEHHAETGGADQYFAYPLGFGYKALMCDVLFKSTMIVLQFKTPDGFRLMELRLHALQENRKEQI